MPLPHRWWRPALGALILAGALCAETLTLNQAVSEAIEKNAGLLAERANIAIADARILTARLRPNPVLTAGSNHLDFLGTGFNDVNGGGPTEISLHSEFTVERGGKRQARVAVAAATRSVVELQFLNAARALALDVQNAFVDVLLAKSVLALARENLEFANTTVNVNTVRLKAGEIAELELARSRLAALQSENSVRRAELQVRTSLTRLETVMGRAKRSPAFDVAGELRRDAAIPDRDEIQRLAADLRPDLLGLRRDTERAGAEWKSQIAQAKPDYTFGAEYIRQQVNAKANSLTFEIGIPIPIFNRNQGEIARAAAERRQAELRLRALEASIAGEIESAWRQLVTARDLLHSIETRMLQQARDVRDITEFSYRRREATLLELLDAQRTFNETMQAYNEARAEYARILYVVDSISGKPIQ
ncbi:MAG: TolC family protein [Acidobacteriota bacterium]